MPEKVGLDISEMPLHELRVRTREVHRLLCRAREEVRTSIDAEGPVDAQVAKLHRIFTEVQELLPGLAWPGDANDEISIAELPAAASPADDEPPASLSPADIARARKIIAELQEGMERMDLLASISTGIDELLRMIEAGRADLRGRLERALAHGS